MPTTTTTSHSRQALSACVAVSAMVAVMVALGHDGRRVVQQLALFAPALALLLWPMSGSLANRLRAAAVWLWAMAFIADSAVRAYLLEAYAAMPDCSFVLAAAANTNAREGAEYLASHWRALALWTGAVVLAGWFLTRYVAGGVRTANPWARWAVVVASVSLLAGAIGLASKPWRGLHPVAFWAEWAGNVRSLRAEWADKARSRDSTLAQAQALAPTVSLPGRGAVVLVISDSVNRDNMSLYGYDRATTPRLIAYKQQLGEQMQVARNAWSVDASTLPALKNIFQFGKPHASDAQHLIALARAAGYKVWWMSNHDDMAIEQQHAMLAHEVEMINRTPGRAGALLDGELLDCLQEALEDKAERKLIVVHLMGLHPHYRLRYPPGNNPFDDSVDSVERSLIDKGRSRWVRQFRHEYDAAMLYHDFVLAETLKLARTAGSTDEYRAWMYLSDHGQEVGHGVDRAGHSPSTAAGYRIPAMMWRNSREPWPNQGSADKPFRSDWAGWVVADLLRMTWHGHTATQNWLSGQYQWREPELPVKVRSFSD